MRQYFANDRALGAQAEARASDIARAQAEQSAATLRTQLDTHTGAQVKTPALRIRSSSRFVSARVGTEASARTDLLDAFLHASHGRLGNVAEVHREALERDALFYGHLSRWYAENGAVRDHNEKLGILEFPQFIAPTLATRDPALVQAFIDECKTGGTTQLNKRSP